MHIIFSSIFVLSNFQPGRFFILKYSFAYFTYLQYYNDKNLKGCCRFDAMSPGIG